jgi:hypothetical protein
MDIYEQLYQAFTSPTVQPTRRTFGKVEYAFIPVSVIEAILEGELYAGEDEPSEPEDTDVEVATPSPTEDEVLATVDPADSTIVFEPPTAAVGFSEPGFSGPGFADDEADGEVAEGTDGEGEEE